MKGCKLDMTKWSVLLAAGLAFALGGCEKKEKEPDPAEKLKELKAAVDTYDFAEKTPKALDQIAEKPAKGDKLLASEKLYVLARAHMDWFFTALLNNDSELMRDLLTRLGVGAKCCPAGKECVKSRRLEMKQRCREDLRRKLHEKLQSLRDMEGDDGAYAALAKKAQDLLTALLTHRPSKPGLYAATVYRLMRSEDPVGNRACLLALADAGANLSAVRVSPPARAGFLLAHVAPYFCAKPMEGIQPNQSPRAVRKSLVASDCGYKCEEIEKLSRKTGEMYQQLMKNCTAEALGFEKKAEKPHFTQQTYLAMVASESLAYAATRVRKDISDPLLERHSGLINRLAKQVDTLRVPAPYPPVMSAEGGWLQPPMVETKQKAPIVAPIHIIMGKLNYFVGVLPVVGLKQAQPRVLGVDRGYTFPGKGLNIPKKVKGPMGTLQANIKKARKDAALFLPPRKPTPKHAGWISIYADSAAPLDNLHGLLKKLVELPSPKVAAVQLLFVADPVAGSASHGATLHIDTPPKDSESMTLMSQKEIAEAVSKQKEAEGKGEAKAKPKAPKAFVLDDPKGTVGDLIRNLVEVRRKHGPAPVYWKIAR